MKTGLWASWRRCEKQPSSLKPRRPRRSGSMAWRLPVAKPQRSRLVALGVARRKVVPKFDEGLKSARTRRSGRPGRTAGSGGKGDIPTRFPRELPDWFGAMRQCGASSRSLRSFCRESGGPREPLQQLMRIQAQRRSCDRRWTSNCLNRHRHFVAEPWNMNVHGFGPLLGISRGRIAASP
jgi:hypothetical protein